MLVEQGPLPLKRELREVSRQRAINTVSALVPFLGAPGTRKQQSIWRSAKNNLVSISFPAEAKDACYYRPGVS